MNEPLEILVLPGTDDAAARAATELRRAGYAPRVTLATTFDAFVSHLTTADWGLLLADHAACGNEPATLIGLARARQPGVPLVILAGTSGDADAIEAVRAGADDVLAPDELHRLALILARPFRPLCSTPHGGKPSQRSPDRESGPPSPEPRDEADYRGLFEDSPISLWVEDFSGVKACLDRLRASGVTDFRTYLLEHPDIVRHCMSLVKVLDVNRKTLDMYGASSKEELLGGLARVAGEWVFDAHRQNLIAIAEGKRSDQMETVNHSLKGDVLHITLQWSVAPGYERTYSRVTVSIIDISARKHVEQALRESQRMLATLMSNLPGMAFRCRNDPNWTMDFVSDGCFDLTGYHTTDLVGNRRVSYGQIIHPPDRDDVWRQIQAALHTRQSYRIVYRIRTAHETIRWVWEQGRGIYAPGGEVVALEGFITDLTRLRQTQEALILSEEKYRRLVEESPMMICRWRPDTTLTFVNTAYAKFFKTIPENLVGRQFIDLLPHKVGRQIRKLIADLHNHKQKFRTEHGVRVPSKGFRWHRWTNSPLLDADGNLIEVQSIGEDITDARKALKALRESEERYRRLAENAQDVVYRYRLRPTRKFDYISPAIRNIIGYTPEDLYAAPKLLFSEIHPDDQAHLDVYLQDKIAIQGPVVLRWRHKEHGRWIPLELRSTPIRNQKGTLLAVEGIARDITDRQRAEEAMIERASLRELSHHIISSQEEERRRLSRELHDEAGQALTAVKINMELLTKKIPDNLTNLRRLAEDTTGLVTGLISEMRRIAAALRPAVLEDLGLLPTLRWYTKSLENRYGIHVKLISRGLSGRLGSSFETTIYRIVQEALTNVVRHAQAKHVFVKVACGKHGLDLVVSDDGMGMDVGSIQRGTGLTGIRERAHLFGGTMHLESQVGMGTTLSVRFPVIPEVSS